MDGFDPVTGEVSDAPTSERALMAGRLERAERAERKHAAVVGTSNLNGKIDAALAQIQPVLKNNKLEKDKPGQRGNYTSLDRIAAILIPRLRSEGVMLRWNAGHVFTMDKTYWLPVTCYLIDRETGESVECTLPMPISQVNPHGLASAFTYGRRLTVLGATGLVTGDEGEDDDGMAAMPRAMEVESEVDSLKRELLENPTEAEAVKWKAAVHKRLQDLEADDFEAVKVAFQDHVKSIRAKIASGEVPAPKPSKPTRGGPKERIAATHSDGGTA